MAELPGAAKKASVDAVRSAIVKSQAALPAAPARTPSPVDSDEDEPVLMPGETATLPAGLIPKPDASEDVITVFSNPTEFTVKHPLHSTWQLCFDSASKSDKAKAWDEALVKVIAFDSVEEFWGSVFAIVLNL